MRRAFRPPPRTGPLRAPLYWLGQIGPGSLLLSRVQVDHHFADIDYGDCALFDPAGCGDEIALLQMSACIENPLTFLDPAHLFVLRGTLAQGFNVDPGVAEGYDIFAGPTTIRVAGPIVPARFEQIAAQLRPVGAESPPPSFPPPALPARYWRALDRVVAAKRRLHSVAAVARALHTRRSRVRDRLRLVALLASLGPRQVVSCPHRR